MLQMQLLKWWQVTKWSVNNEEQIYILLFANLYYLEPWWSIYYSFSSVYQFPPLTDGEKTACIVQLYRKGLYWSRV